MLAPFCNYPCALFSKPRKCWLIQLQTENAPFFYIALAPFCMPDFSLKADFSLFDFSCPFCSSGTHNGGLWNSVRLKDLEVSKWQNSKFSWGSAPNPAGGADSAHPDPPAVWIRDYGASCLRRSIARFACFLPFSPFFYFHYHAWFWAILGAQILRNFKKVGTNWNKVPRISRLSKFFLLQIFLSCLSIDFNRMEMK